VRFADTDGETDTERYAAGYKPEYFLAHALELAHGGGVRLGAGGCCLCLVRRRCAGRHRAFTARLVDAAQHPLGELADLSAQWVQVSAYSPTR
jgi:hypothetical protein